MQRGPKSVEYLVDLWQPETMPTTSLDTVVKRELPQPHVASKGWMGSGWFIIFRDDADELE
jgi:hypothetical protein